MKKKNDTSTADTVKDKAKKGLGGKATREGKDGSGIAKFAGPGLGATALVLVLMGLALAWLQFGRHQQMNERHLANALVESQSGLLELALNQASARLDRFATSDPIGRALEEDRAEELAGQLSAMLPGRIAILPAQTSPDERQLSFTARDLIEKARDGQEPEPVMVPGETPRLLNARLTPDGKGVVLLDASLAQLEKQLASQNLQGAYMQIEQEGGAEMLSRGSAQAGVTATAQAPFNINVSLTMPSTARDPALVLLFSLMVLGGLLLVLLLQAFVFRALSQAVRKDGAMLSNLAQELARDSNALPTGTFSFRPLQMVAPVMQRLAQKLAGQQKSRQGSSGSPSPAARPSSMEVEGEEPRTRAGDTEASARKELPATIFRAYDIRGRADNEVTEENVHLIGRAVGSEASERGQSSIVVARDGRTSSPALEKALVQGITESGIDVIQIGAVPTPVLYYAVGVLDTSNGVCVTGSHNPAQDNGIKVVLEGSCLHGEQIQKLRERIAQGNLIHDQGQGRVSETDMVSHYIAALQDDIVLARPLHVVADCANGITGNIVPDIFRALGCDLTELYTEVDGSFPNHGPDPGNPDNLAALIAKVQETGADLGIAFDGDGDRLTVVTGQGEIIWPDRLMMLYARDLLSRSPGADIIFDVKSSRELSRLISQQGGRPLMWKTGHSLLHEKLQETGAPLAGEMSGHIFFGDRWNGFDDALYAAARLLEILSLESDDIQAIFDGLPTGIATPEIPVPVSDENKFALMEKVVASAGDNDEGSLSTLDGLRIDFEDGWGLIRASNTAPKLTARFEGRDQAALERIQQLFRERLLAADSSLDLPF